MIPNQWYIILDAREVPQGKPVGVTRMGEKLVIWRDPHGQVTCMRDLCPHRGVALSVGQLKGECIECPFHGFLYDTSGRCRLIPANGREAEPPKAFQIYTYPTREAHGFIYIWWGDPREVYPELPFFDSIVEEKYSYATLRDHWATHYSRAIENQLDVVHLPFVHHNTIGRQPHRVTGRWFKSSHAMETGLLNLWVYNQVDEGQTARTLPAPDA
jgi:phenylpropionate dioxygenase-like ring-hydroxylating dioxygenase large terminal subunit